MLPLRLVLDTNILVSALILGSRSLRWLYPAFRSKLIVPLLSDATVAELAVTVRHPKFGLSPEALTRVLVECLPWGEMMVVPDPPPLVPECRDPDDRPFLELALFAQADALVTGDRDLLALAAAFPLPIITPGQLSARLPNIEYSPFVNN